MKRLMSYIMILLLIFSLSACGNKNDQNDESGKNQIKQIESEITTTVEGFGSALKQVSLLAPEELVKQSLKEYYGQYVTSSLLEKWMEDPVNAPGRVVSSPWPDRIEIDRIKEIKTDQYEVTGKIIEITSTESGSNDAAAKRNVTLTVIKADNAWLIDDVQLGEYEQPEAVSFINNEYGFRINLPDSWRNYTVVTEQWEGNSLEAGNRGKQIETGTIIMIRHPLWTAEKPRQDIPIMVFTKDQWNLLQEEKFSVGAAPMAPKELGKNSKYVFALPARYNYAFPEGFEEVEDILENPANFSAF